MTVDCRSPGYLDHVGPFKREIVTVLFSNVNIYIVLDMTSSASI